HGRRQRDRGRGRGLYRLVGHRVHRLGPRGRGGCGLSPDADSGQPDRDAPAGQRWPRPMKLSGAAAVGYFAKPDPDAAGILIYGQDAMRVALRRQEVILALIGPEGEGEMRLTRLQGGDLRKDPALIMDAM